MVRAATQHRALLQRMVFFPRIYRPGLYWNIFQWKSKTSSVNDPFFILNIGNRSDGDMYFYLYDWQRRASNGQTKMDVPVGRWFQVEAYYRCAADNTGRVIFWQDRQLLFDVARSIDPLWKWRLPMEPE